MRAASVPPQIERGRKQEGITYDPLGPLNWSRSTQVPQCEFFFRACAGSESRPPGLIFTIASVSGHGFTGKRLLLGVIHQCSIVAHPRQADDPRYVHIATSPRP